LAWIQRGEPERGNMKNGQSFSEYSTPKKIERAWWGHRLYRAIPRTWKKYKQRKRGEDKEFI